MKRFALYVSAASPEGFREGLLRGAARIRRCRGRVVTVVGEVGCEAPSNGPQSVPPAMLDRLNNGEFDSIVAAFSSANLTPVVAARAGEATVHCGGGLARDGAVREAREPRGISSGNVLRRYRAHAVGRMLAAVLAGEVEVVLSTAADRMSRDSDDHTRKTAPSEGGL